MQLNEYFSLEELISEQAYRDLMRLLDIATWIRRETGLPVVINNWHRGGRLHQRGLRLPYNEAGSPRSEHRNLRALDLNIGAWSGARMFNWAAQNAEALYRLGVRRLEHPEDAPTWLHLDLREHGRRSLQIIRPRGVAGEIKVD